MSNTSKPLDLKYDQVWSNEMDGDGRSTESLFEVNPSRLPVNTGYEGAPAC